MTLPEKFKFYIDYPTPENTYDAEMKSDKCVVSWVEYGNKKSVDYVVAEVYRYIEDGSWKIISEQPTTTLLEKIKQFTIDTNVSIFVTNGQYEVYYDESCNPAKASSDEELEKTIDAILLLDKATNGG